MEVLKIYKNRVANKVLCDKAINIAKNPQYDGYRRELASMVYKFFDKEASGGPVKIKIMPNQQLGEELHKPIIKKFEKQNVHSSFRQILGCWSSRYATNK